MILKQLSWPHRTAELWKTERELEAVAKSGPCGQRSLPFEAVSHENSGLKRGWLQQQGYLVFSWVFNLQFCHHPFQLDLIHKPHNDIAYSCQMSFFIFLILPSIVQYGCVGACVQPTAQRKNEKAAFFCRALIGSRCWAKQSQRIKCFGKFSGLSLPFLGSGPGSQWLRSIHRSSGWKKHFNWIVTQTWVLGADVLGKLLKSHSTHSKSRAKTFACSTGQRPKLFFFLIQPKFFFFKLVKTWSLWMTQFRLYLAV